MHFDFKTRFITAACNFDLLSAQMAPHTRRFSEPIPEPQNVGKHSVSRRFSTFSPTLCFSFYLLFLLSDFCFFFLFSGSFCCFICPYCRKFDFSIFFHEYLLVMFLKQNKHVWFCSKLRNSCVSSWRWISCENHVRSCRVKCSSCGTRTGALWRREMWFWGSDSSTFDGDFAMKVMGSSTTGGTQ